MEDDLGTRQAEGTRGADMVFAHHFQHGSPHDSRQIADPTQAHRKAGQDQMPDLIPDIAIVAGAQHGKPVKLDGEKEQGIDRHDE